MKKIIYFILFLIISFFVLNSCESSKILFNLKTNNSIQENKLLDLHNQERTKRGYNPLMLDSDLCEYAQKHSETMANKNSLYHSKMSDLQKVLNSSVVGENIAWGQESEEDVVSSWMWSPGHRWNILGSSYKKVGFGIKKDKNNRTYWCVVFSS